MIVESKNVIFRSYTVRFNIKGVTGTVLYQAFIGINEEDELYIDIDIIDYEEIYFHSNKIESFHKLKESFHDLGINIQEEINEYGNRFVNKNSIKKDIKDLIKFTFNK